MNYIQHVNACLRAAVERTDEPFVVFGQNVAAGSRIGGLAAGLESSGNRLVINTPNIENTQVGMGFGLMLRGVSSIFMMKQQDFLLLGIDHLVNSYNVVRMRRPDASFTILAIVVDSGWEGPQSCLNNLGDICSISHVPGYVASNREDVAQVFATHMVAPGCRILGVSQRLFRQPVIEPPGPARSDEAAEIFSYVRGNDATVVAFNFAFPQAVEIHAAAEQAGASVSLFSVSAMLPSTWAPIIEDLHRTRRLVVVDDSKSANRTSDRLLAEAAATCRLDAIVTERRAFSEHGYRPNADSMPVDAEAVVDRLGLLRPTARSAG
jgi:pyruvate dehydrogenase E1 component beta subunit